MGNVPWSKAWAEAQNNDQAWRLLLKWRSNPSSKVKLHRLRLIILQTGLKDAFKKSIPDLIKEVQKSKKKLKETTCAASELRRTEQREIVERAHENKQSLHAEYKSRWDIEESRRLGRVLKQLKGTTKHEVDKVTININGTIQECTTQISMEQTLFKEGTHRFSQSEREPPMHEAITSLVGFWGEKE